MKLTTSHVIDLQEFKEAVAKKLLTSDYSTDLTLPEQIEAATVEVGLEFNQFNQSRTAKFLNISRGTLRWKAFKYFGNKYVTANHFNR